MTCPSDDTSDHASIDAELVSELTESILAETRTRHLGCEHIPNREAVGRLIDLLRQMAFPGFFDSRTLTPRNLPLHVQELLARISIASQEQIRSVIRYLAHSNAQTPCDLVSGEPDAVAARITRQFMARLPEIRRLIALDVQAAFDGDPAAIHTDEVVFCYPGLDAIFAHRIAHELTRLHVPLLPRLIQELAHNATGIDIHPGATIGESFFIDHGTGVVIGETTEIGDHCRIYQGVTLGAKSFQRDETGRLVRGVKRHPTIGDRVTIYAGAVILGGDTIIGDDCVINGSVFLTRSVPPGHIVRQKSPELVMRSNPMNRERNSVVDAGG